MGSGPRCPLPACQSLLWGAQGLEVGVPLWRSLAAWAGWLGWEVAATCRGKAKQLPWGLLKGRPQALLPISAPSAPGTPGRETTVFEAATVRAICCQEQQEFHSPARQPLRTIAGLNKDDFPYLCFPSADWCYQLALIPTFVSVIRLLASREKAARPGEVESGHVVRVQPERRRGTQCGPFALFPPEGLKRLLGPLEDNLPPRFHFSDPAHPCAFQDAPDPLLQRPPRS